MPHEFAAVIGEKQEKVHTVKRRRCMFPPGVTATYDAYLDTLEDQTRISIIKRQGR
jgi:hypothetical protein